MSKFPKLSIHEFDMDGEGCIVFGVNTDIKYTNREAAAREVDRIDSMLSAMPDAITALRDLLEQLDAIGIPHWHGAEGLSLDLARNAVTLFDEDAARCKECWRPNADCICDNPNTGAAP